MSEPVDNFDAAETATDTVTRRKKSAPAEDSKPVKKVKINIHKTKDEKSDVYVSVNEYTCLIKRGEVVEVPEFVVEALNNASVSTLDDETGKYAEVPRFPFSVLN